MLLVGWAPAAREVTVDGAELVALTPADAERVLFELERLERLERALDAADRLISAQDRLVATSSRTVDLAVRLVAAERARADAPARGLLDGQPYFWTAVGALVAAVATAYVATSR